MAEEYPRGDWADDDIADFVMHRFDPDRMFATPDGHFHLHDGSLSPKSVTFWAGVRNRAGEIYGRPATPVDDYVMTEVVHCKSKGDVGVKAAAGNCADRHLDHILALSPAPLLVILGKRAGELLVCLGGIWDQSSAQQRPRAKTNGPISRSGTWVAATASLPSFGIPLG